MLIDDPLFPPERISIESPLAEFLCSRASVLETLLTAQTRLVLPTAVHTEDRRERRTQTDRHENIDASDGGNTFTPERYRFELKSANTFPLRYRAPRPTHNVFESVAVAAPPSIVVKCGCVVLRVVVRGVLVVWCVVWWCFCSCCVFVCVVCFWRQGPTTHTHCLICCTVGCSAGADAQIRSRARCRPFACRRFELNSAHISPQETGPHDPHTVFLICCRRRATFDRCEVWVCGSSCGRSWWCSCRVVCCVVVFLFLLCVCVCGMFLFRAPRPTHMFLICCTVGCSARADPQIRSRAGCRSFACRGRLPHHAFRR